MTDTDDRHNDIKRIMAEALETTEQEIEEGSKQNKTFIMKEIRDTASNAEETKIHDHFCSRNGLRSEFMSSKLDL